MVIELITMWRHNMTTITDIEDFSTQFEMLAVNWPYLSIIILEISEQILFFACTQDGGFQGVIEAKFWAEI